MHVYLLNACLLICFTRGTHSTTLDESALRQYILQKENSFNFSSHLLCNCTTQACDSEAVSRFGNVLRGICISDGPLCMISIERVEDDRHYVAYQCVMADQWQPPGAPQPFVCLSHRDKTHENNAECCSDRHFCNGHSQLKLSAAPPSIGDNRSHLPTILVIAVPLALLLTVLSLFAAYRYRLLTQNKKKKKQLEQSSWRQTGMHSDGTTWSLNPLLKSEKVCDVPPSYHDDNSGSGAGGPSLVQRTIANQVQLLESIGQGRFGQVFKAEWRGEFVAVKIFSTRDESSYYRELDIFLTCMLRHPNIVEFKGGDNKDTGQSTQLWLLTEYHEQGSLFDVLEARALDTSSALRMLRSLANGLAFLHTELEGTHSKPAIAHRDLKSKNILVKKSGEVAIADFGLAVRQRRSGLDLPPKGKAGTVRYLAPEVLDGSIGSTFDSWRAADMYSTGLIIWEVAWRTKAPIAADEHQLPYFDCVSSNPSEEEMLAVVVHRGIRPSSQRETPGNAVALELNALATECWARNPYTRNHALVLRNALDRSCRQHLISS